ncbi:MAG: hypothetical protein ACRC92_15305 [Peptostreptococcaceae bacterium]
MKQINIEKFNDLVKLVRKHVSSFVSGDINDMELIDALYGDQPDDHGVGHISEVLHRAKEIHGMELDMVQKLSVILHDIGDRIDRDDHEHIGKTVTLRSLDGVLPSEYIFLISDAISTHRASYEGEYKTYVAELVASADRSIETVEDTVYRSYRYAVNKKSQSHEKACIHSYEHMMEKFSSNGYVKYPKMFIDFYGEKLVNFTKGIDALTLEKVVSIVEEKRK